VSVIDPTDIKIEQTVLKNDHFTLNEYLNQGEMVCIFHNWLQIHHCLIIFQVSRVVFYISRMGFDNSLVVWCVVVKWFPVSDGQDGRLAVSSECLNTGHTLIM